MLKLLLNLNAVLESKMLLVIFCLIFPQYDQGNCLRWKLQFKEIHVDIQES